MDRPPRAARLTRRDRASKPSLRGASASVQVLVAMAVLAALASCGPAHSPHQPAKRPFPTLEQYSDGASTLAASVATALYARDRATLERLVPQGATVRLASAPAGPTFESPSTLKVERFAVAATPLARDEALRILLQERETFIGVVHDDTTLVGSRALGGDRREIRIHRRFAGPSHDGPRQEESWWTWQIVRGADPSAGWTIASAVEDRRVVVSAHQPLFRQVYPEEGAENWKAGTTRADARRARVVPGLHDAGAVAVLNDCFNRKPCLLIGGGEGLAALVAGDDREYDNRAKLLGLDGITGEVESILSGDFDNNGLTDLFLTFDHAPARLLLGQRFLNPGDDNTERMEYLGFQEATAGSGLEGLEGPARSAVALDADNDGRLDLYVVEYGDTSKTGPSLDGRNGTANRLFRNVTEPGGHPMRFEDVSRASGTDDAGWGLGAAAADYDGDGRMDLFVTNDFGADVLYHNVTPKGGAIRFENATRSAGVQDEGGAGACWGDFDGDGDLDLYVSREDFEQRWILADPRFPFSANRDASRAKRSLEARLRGGVLYRNEGAKSGRFTRVADSATADAGRGWGAAWLDADGDGRLDLAVANGLLAGKGGPSREIELWNEIAAGWDGYAKGAWTIDLGEEGITGPQSERLFINLGDGTFADAGYVGGFDTTADLRGLVAADITMDGAPDLVGAAFLDSPVIYHNTNAGSPGRVRVRLEGTRSNWDAAGAIVKLTAGGVTQTRLVSAGGSFLSDAGRYVDFGYGTAKQIDRVEVLWPSGQKSVLDKPAAERRTIDVTEP